MLSQEEVKHIAQLARLDLNQKELEKIPSQLSDVLNYIAKLKEVNTANIKATAQVTGLENVVREDEVWDWDKDEVQVALNQALDLENREIKVKRVLD